MSDLWQVAASCRSGRPFVGGGILLAGRLLMCFTSQPALCAAIGVAAVTVALFAIPLSLLPGWLPITVPSGESPREAVAEVASNVSHEPAEEAMRPNRAATPLPAMPVVPPTASPESAPESPSIREVEPALRDAGEHGVISLGGSGSFCIARLWRDRRRLPWPADRRGFRTGQNLAVGKCAAGSCGASIPRIGGQHLSAGGTSSPDRAAGPVCFGVTRPCVLVPLSRFIAGDDVLACGASSPMS